MKTYQNLPYFGPKWIVECLIKLIRPNPQCQYNANTPGGYMGDS